MRSRSYVLGALLATAVLTATGQCDEITPSAGHATRESTAADNQEAGGGQPAESARSAGRGPNPVAGDTLLVPENWQIAGTLAGHKDMVKSLAFSPDGKRLFSGSYDGEIKVWDTHTHKELTSIVAHRRSVYGGCRLAVWRSIGLGGRSPIGESKGLGRADAAIAGDAFVSAACVLSRVLA